MKLEDIRSHLLGKKGTYEEYPFGPEAMVFKVMGKIFAIIAWGDNPLKISLKCDPDLALNLREKYKNIEPGYYMNKKHWNTITLDGTISKKEIISLHKKRYLELMNNHLENQNVNNNINNSKNIKSSILNNDDLNNKNKLDSILGKVNIIIENYNNFNSQRDQSLSNQQNNNSNNILNKLKGWLTKNILRF